MCTIYFVKRKRTLGGKLNGQQPTKNDTKNSSWWSGNIGPATVDCGNIGFEMRCVLYNLGAAHSRLAAAQDRSPLTAFSPSTNEEIETPSSTALKIACTHLQCAAWAFEVCLIMYVYHIN